MAAAGEHLAAGDAAAGEAGTIEAVVTTRVARAAVARARNDPEQVVKVLAPLAENTRLIPMATSLAWWPALIGAMIDSGELAMAAGQIELLDTAAQQRGLDMQARIAGARARLEAARGRPDQACSGYDRAIALLSVDDPLLDRAELHHRFGQLLAARGASDARPSTSCAWPMTCSPGRAQNRSGAGLRPTWPRRGSRSAGADPGPLWS